jgi:hypothetical protein
VIGRQAPFLILGLGLLLGGCAAPAVPSPTPGMATPALPSPSVSGSPGPNATRNRDRSPGTATPGTGACSGQLAERVRAAVDGVEAYSYAAQGFVFQPVFDPDPLATPATERVETAFEGAYRAPDRASLSHTGGGSAPGTEATVTIGRDLYVETAEGWVKLPDAADPDLANVLAGLLEDAGGGWQGQPTVDGGCRLIARRPLPGRSGERETVILVDPAEALPSRLELDVTGAVGRNGEANDLGLVFLFRYDPALTIEPPI